MDLLEGVQKSKDYPGVTPTSKEVPRPCFAALGNFNTVLSTALGLDKPGWPFYLLGVLH